jgi:hypothetical protein
VRRLVTLNRPLPTLAELVEVAQTGAVPAARCTPVTPETTQMQCLLCAGPLVIVNDPDWAPKLPNALSTRRDGRACGMGSWWTGTTRIWWATVNAVGRRRR